MMPDKIGKPGRVVRMSVDDFEATQVFDLHLGALPVSIAVEISDMRRLVDLAARAAQDVIADAAARYPGDTPIEVRRRSNDQADALALLELVAALNAKLPLSEGREEAT